LRLYKKTVVASNISAPAPGFMRWIKRGAACTGFIRPGSDSHGISADFARFLDVFVSNLQHVAISYKLLMQRNTLRARQNFLHF